jgi:type II secretory pathway pseudopilin PulG
MQMMLVTVILSTLLLILSFLYISANRKVKEVTLRLQAQVASLQQEQEGMENSIVPKHDEFRAIGFITANFAALEQSMRYLIWQLLIKGQGTTDFAVKNLQFQVGLVITAELSFARLSALLSSLYGQIETDSNAVSELDTILKRASQVEGKRNQIVHSAWMITDGPKQNLFRVKFTAKRSTGLKMQQEKMTLKELDDIANSIGEVYRDITNFMWRHDLAYGQ